MHQLIYNETFYSQAENLRKRKRPQHLFGRLAWVPASVDLRGLRAEGSLWVGLGSSLGRRPPPCTDPALHTRAPTIDPRESLLTPAQWPPPGSVQELLLLVSPIQPSASMQPSWTSAGSTWDTLKFYFCRLMFVNAALPPMPPLGLFPALPRPLIKLTGTQNSKFNKQIPSPGVKPVA